MHPKIIANTLKALVDPSLVLTTVLFGGLFGELLNGVALFGGLVGGFGTGLLCGGITGG